MRLLRSDGCRLSVCRTGKGRGFPENTVGRRWSLAWVLGGFSLCTDAKRRAKRWSTPERTATGCVGSAGGKAASVAEAVTRGCGPDSGTMNSQIGGAGFPASLTAGRSGCVGSTPQNQYLIHVHMTLLLTLLPKGLCPSVVSASQLKLNENLLFVSKQRFSGFYGSNQNRAVHQIFPRVAGVRPSAT